MDPNDKKDLINSISISALFFGFMYAAKKVRYYLLKMTRYQQQVDQYKQACSLKVDKQFFSSLKTQSQKIDNNFKKDKTKTKIVLRGVPMITSSNPIQIQLYERPNLNDQVYKNITGSYFYLVMNNQDFQFRTKNIKTQNNMQIQALDVLQKYKNQMQNNKITKKQKLTQFLSNQNGSKNNLNQYTFIKCDLKQVSVLNNIVSVQSTPRFKQQIKNSFLYSILKQNFVRDYQYRFYQSTTSIKLIPTGSIIVYGTIQFDNNIFKLTPQILGKYRKQILMYLQGRVHSKLLPYLFYSIAMICFGYFTIKNLSKLASIPKVIKKLFSKKQKQLNKPQLYNHIECDAKAKFKCKECKGNIMNIVFDCGHLSLCKDCADKFEKCFQCNKKVNNKIRIYQS